MPALPQTRCSFVLNPELYFLITCRPLAIKSPFPEGKGWAGAPGHGNPRKEEAGRGSSAQMHAKISGCDGSFCRKPSLGLDWALLVLGLETEQARLPNSAPGAGLPAGERGRCCNCGPTDLLCNLALPFSCWLPKAITREV